jgi:hypothetical protein
VDVTTDDLMEAATAARTALQPVTHRDWTIPAGDLAWDVRTTLAHVADALGWYAAHLAAQSPGRLRFDFRVHDDASNDELLDVLGAAAVTLAQVARAAPQGARGHHPAGMADGCWFLAMGCDEILVHCWDATGGFGVEFARGRNSPRTCWAGSSPVCPDPTPRNEHCSRPRFRGLGRRSWPDGWSGAHTRWLL